VEEERNERLEYLLRKTDEYMSTITATVQQHQSRQQSQVVQSLSHHFLTLALPSPLFSL
jgi:hypothetical protein